MTRRYRTIDLSIRQLVGRHTAVVSPAYRLSEDQADRHDEVEPRRIGSPGEICAVGGEHSSQYQYRPAILGGTGGLRFHPDQPSDQPGTRCVGLSASVRAKVQSARATAIVNSTAATTTMIEVCARRYRCAR